MGGGIRTERRHGESCQCTRPSPSSPQSPACSQRSSAEGVELLPPSSFRSPTEVFQPGAAVLEQTAPNAEPCDVILPAVDPTVRKIRTVDLVLSDSVEIVGDGPEDPIDSLVVHCQSGGLRRAELMELNSDDTVRRAIAFSGLTYRECVVARVPVVYLILRI